jgi:hypothetical protein
MPDNGGRARTRKRRPRHGIKTSYRQQGRHVAGVPDLLPNRKANPARATPYRSRRPPAERHPRTVSAQPLPDKGSDATSRPERDCFKLSSGTELTIASIAAAAPGSLRLCHGRERQRRPMLTIASTIHATRAGRSPPTDCDRRESAPCRSGEGFVWALASRATHKRADGANSLPEAGGAYARGPRPPSVTAVPILAICETSSTTGTLPCFALVTGMSGLPLVGGRCPRC